MTTDLATRRLLQAGALFLIGNGIMGLIKPRWHALLWQWSPQLVRAATEELADHPTTARVVYLAETAAGFALAASCDDGTES